jgi:hypothetical protein
MIACLMGWMMGSVYDSMYDGYMIACMMGYDSMDDYCCSFISMSSSNSLSEYVYHDNYVRNNDNSCIIL